MMPRFFFHIYDEMIFLDEEGMEMVDVQAAKLAALAGAREMICEQVKRGRLNLDHRIEVEDEDGMSVLALPFGQAVRMETGR